jgi:LacI family transcriptional regulator
MYNNDITGIVCASDEMAIGALNCLTDRGIKVPEDVSIIGFDDIKISKFIRPRLTTIQQPITATGEMAAKMLINIINKNEKMEERDIILKGNLIERESTRPI